jgi:hypothetical protein
LQPILLQGESTPIADAMEIILTNNSICLDYQQRLDACRKYLTSLNTAKGN